MILNILILLFPVSCDSSPPVIVSDKKNFVLAPNSQFNITCIGKKNVLWDDPLPSNTYVIPGFHTATLLIHKAEAANTREYVCVYEDEDLESTDENIASIYVFVPGKNYNLFNTIHTYDS